MNQLEKIPQKQFIMESGLRNAELDHAYKFCLIQNKKNESVFYFIDDSRKAGTKNHHDMINFIVNKYLNGKQEDGEIIYMGIFLKKETKSGYAFIVDSIDIYFTEKEEKNFIETIKCMLPDYEIILMES
ncbi:MAG: hypothetical protein ABIF17_01370 [Patescibacteria group bacterium]